ncbi:MAG: hypothetical protein JNM72_27890 [Deltaproteobacteria bacterium]|nr:hypothetical protein [Deltaproteobacteria bacterium]
MSKSLITPHLLAVSLGLAACGGEPPAAPPAPVVTTTALPAPAAARPAMVPAPGSASAPLPAAAPLPAPITAEGPRVVAHKGVAVACVDSTGVKGGDQCAGSMTMVSIYRPVGGAVLLTETPAEVASGPGADPCTWQRAVSTSGPPTQVPLRRPMTSLPLDNATYTRLIAEVTGVKAPKLTALLRIDLDNDGRDEVLFSADSHPAAEAAPGGQSYSAAGIRRVKADGAAETLFFFERRVELSGEVPDTVRASLLGFTDLEGDGKLEVVVQDTHHEGEGQTVWRVDEAGVHKLGETGCGV